MISLVPLLPFLPASLCIVFASCLRLINVLSIARSFGSTYCRWIKAHGIEVVDGKTSVLHTMVMLGALRATVKTEPSYLD